MKRSHWDELELYYWKPTHRYLKLRPKFDGGSWCGCDMYSFNGNSKRKCPVCGAKEKQRMKKE